MGRIALRAERGAARLSRLTLDEQRTMLTLWCVSRSPLMLGCDLPSSPPETLALLTNTDLLDVLKDSRNNRELLRDGGLVLWAAENATSDDRFVAVFNTGAAELVRTIPVADLGVPAGFTGRVREAWSGDEAAIGLQDGRPALEVKLPAHSAQPYRFHGQ